MSDLLRLDQWLLAKKLVNSRERAGEMIRKGSVQVDGEVVTKPGRKYPADIDISLLEAPMPWVSRGALKLEAALAHFGVDPKACVCLDVGASTGGFTEVLLHHGAKKVFALDSGTGQLAERLRIHSQVVNLEQQNIRATTQQVLGEAVDLIAIDVSFISLTLVLPELKQLMKPDAQVVALVKPQFEVGKDGLGKNGIVRDVRKREEALNTVIRFAEERGFSCLGRMDSPISGGDGNREYLIHLK